MCIYGKVDTDKKVYVQHLFLFPKKWAWNIIFPCRFFFLDWGNPMFLQKERGSFSLFQFPISRAIKNGLRIRDADFSSVSIWEKSPGLLCIAGGVRCHSPGKKSSPLTRELNLFFSDFSFFLGNCGIGFQSGPEIRPGTNLSLLSRPKCIQPSDEKQEIFARATVKKMRQTLALENSPITAQKNYFCGKKAHSSAELGTPVFCAQQFVVTKRIN